MKKYFCIFCLMIFSSCGFYSFSGSTLSVKTVAVPIFENETVEVDVEESIASEIRDAIIKDGNMKVVSESQADAVLSGKIVDVKEEADTFSKSEQANQFKIRVFADISFFDKRRNKVIWEEKRMEGWARYDAKDTSARDEAINEALQMLAKDIIDKTVSGW
jgi:hypothetical protein